MRQVGIGIVGSGGMARHRGQAFAALPGCRVRAVAACNPTTGPALAGLLKADLAPSWEALVERTDVDALAVCSSNDSHGAIALGALSADKAVFVEYPLARHESEVEALVRDAGAGGTVLRVAHGEVVDTGHAALRAKLAAMGQLMAAVFVRLTPGRGARPEVLFNLPVSGPPALFFIYHVYPLIDLFGPAQWVEAWCRYEGLEEGTGRYQGFHNTMTAGLAGGTAIWTWAGGIQTDAAEQYQRLVLTGGTLICADGRWTVATAKGREALAVPTGDPQESLEALFLRELRGEETGWRGHLATAAAAARLCLGAERAMTEGRRVELPVAVRPGPSAPLRLKRPPP